LIRHILKFSNRTLIVTFEILAVLALVLSIAFGAFVWKVSQGPMSIGFAKEYVESALSGIEDGVQVTFDDIVFSWPELRGPFLLDLTGLHVHQGGAEANTLTINSASVGLSRRALLFGRIRPVSVIIKGPSLELVRDKDGKLSLFLQTKKPEEEKPQEEPAAETKNPGQEVAQIFRDMATNKRGSLIARLRKFEIRNASVAIRDYDYGLSWYLTELDFSIGEEADGVVSSLHVALPGGRTESASIDLDMAYRKETDDFRAKGKINDINPYVISRFLPVPDALSGQDLYFSGDMEGTLDANLVPTSFRVSGAIPEGKITLPEEYDAPILLKDIAISSDYNGADETLSISKLSGEIGGIAFSGEAGGKLGKDSMTLPVRMNVAGAELKQVAALFPKSEHDGEAYEWLGRNIEGGSVSDVALDMELTAERVLDAETQAKTWSFDAPQMKLSFAFEGAKVTYNETLMPAENAKGKGMLDLGAEVLEISDASANIGDMEGSDVKVKVTELMTAGGGYVAVNAKVKGPLATALNYIAADPINMGEEEIGLDPKTVKGTIDAQVDVGLPTVKDVPKEEVNVEIAGTLNALNIPDVVEGLPLSGGPLELKTEPGGFTIKGSAQLAGRDTKIDWHQFFESAGHPYSMKVTASVGADQELRNHFGVDLDDYISGTMPVDVTYTDKGDKTATIDVKGDLNPVRVYIDPFKFEKPVGTPGTVTLNGSLKDDSLKQLTDIEISSKDFSVSKGTINFAPLNGKKADIASGSLPSASIGRTQVSASFDTDKSGALVVKAKAPVFDLEPFLAEGEASDISVQPDAPKEKQRAMKITLNAEKMLAKNGQSVRAARAYIELDDDGDMTQIEYDGGIGKNNGDVYVRFKPDEAGRRTFRLDTNDAGNLLYTFGVYENVHGGTLRIYGQPKDNDPRGDLHGSMQMENFRVVKAPALARLLSLMSLTGMTQLLGNEGLVFSKLESGFEWRFRPAGNLLIIKDGKTSGSSIGLTFSGVLDRGKKTTDVSGTIIPVTEINQFLGNIPLVGNILGGAGGLIAATYSMKGPTSDPNIMVNPLSVLAPGIIRKILFEGGYESKIPERDAPASSPDTKSAPAQEKGVPVPNGNPKPTNKITNKPVQDTGNQ
jgi:hypothetical protein